jgi:tetratricopeptide (TPR) repeat protein
LLHSGLDPDIAWKLAGDASSSPRQEADLFLIDRLPEAMQERFWAWETAQRAKSLEVVQAELTRGKGLALYRSLLAGARRHELFVMRGDGSDKKALGAARRAVLDPGEAAEVLLGLAEKMLPLGHPAQIELEKALDDYRIGYDQAWRSGSGVDDRGVKRIASALIRGFERAIDALPEPPTTRLHVLRGHEGRRVLTERSTSLLAGVGAKAALWSARLNALKVEKGQLSYAEDINALLDEGLGLDLEGDPKRAIDRYDLVLGVQPDNPDALFRKGIALIHLAERIRARDTGVRLRRAKERQLREAVRCFDRFLSGVARSGLYDPHANRLTIPGLAKLTGNVAMRHALRLISPALHARAEALCSIAPPSKSEESKRALCAASTLETDLDEDRARTLLRDALLNGHNEAVRDRNQVLADNVEAVMTIAHVSRGRKGRSAPVV